jgi:hypothetical protein
MHAIILAMYASEIELRSIFVLTLSAFFNDDDMTLYAHSASCPVLLGIRLLLREYKIV